MRRHTDRGSIAPIAALAGAIVGFITLWGIIVAPGTSEPLADMYIKPNALILEAGEIFTVHIMVYSKVSANVFAGELIFDRDVFRVRSIDYNTSIADLWAERPWYSNGEGTLNFAGGTTRTGGFLGTDTLITITFEAQQTGSGVLAITDAHILEHDGLGTEITLPESINAVFTIDTDTATTSLRNMIGKDRSATTYSVVPSLPTTDLNDDGKQSIADISIFMLRFGAYDQKHDFNLDGKVNLTDLNILLGAK